MMLIIVYAFVGWLAGIAINHAANILPTRQSLWHLPACAACGQVYPFWTWSTLLAWLSGRQRCPVCGHPRGRLIRSAIIELISPLIFAFLFHRYGLSLHLILVSLYTSILLLITVTDLEHRLILNYVIFPAILLALVAAFFTPGLFWPSALVGGAAGFVIAYLAALLSRGGLGGGDVTLSAFLGLIIGFPYILLSLIFGVFLGGGVALLLLLTRRVGLKSFIPYGPFLTLTGWIMLIWRAEIWQYYFG
uniref:Prepilin peptidase / N-methyltransferase n=1 Tax=uncultured Chloroflexota bacterium TaxID=166587 RepID=H5SN33_9CHLR|nr:prepilin peptidase / N-methyltransferase [uncultured Chloroflexota bacterium]